MRSLALSLIPLLSACDWLPLEEAGKKGHEGGKGGEPMLGIALSYHGILLDEDNQPVDLDPQSLLALQEELAAEMIAATEVQGLAGSYKRIQSEVLDIDERIIAHEAFIRTSLEVDPSLEAPYVEAADLLAIVTFDLAQFTVDFWDKHTRLREILEQEGIIPFIPADPTAAGEQYIEDCRSHDVPIPPSWPHKAWKSRGDLDPAIAFLPNDRIAVYTYEDPAVPGICMALPRIDEGELELMGVICQSAATGAACFWDNVDAQTRTRLTGPLEQSMAFVRLANGDSLAENCTSCHRGENVFIVHPGSPLDRGTAARSGAWYTPISSQGWENPPAFAERGSSECSGCHAIGAIDGAGSNYCRILRHTANTTMPPGGAPAGSSATTGLFADDLGRLRSVCGW